MFAFPVLGDLANTTVCGLMECLIHRYVTLTIQHLMRQVCFTAKKECEWAYYHGIMLLYHILHHLEEASLVEHLNAFLTAQGRANSKAHSERKACHISGYEVFIKSEMHMWFPQYKEKHGSRNKRIEAEVDHCFQRPTEELNIYHSHNSGHCRIRVLGVQSRCNLNNQSPSNYKLWWPPGYLMCFEPRSQHTR